MPPHKSPRVLSRTEPAKLAALVLLWHATAQLGLLGELLRELQLQHRLSPAMLLSGSALQWNILLSKDTTLPLGIGVFISEAKFI
ncbi:hypothetical protein NXS19_004682 [Fusarium pseudograminearum]|nr:hypothetical protein NXS19_004682 [Fusarium pseudograminearum]